MRIIIMMFTEKIQPEHLEDMKGKSIIPIAIDDTRKAAVLRVDDEEVNIESLKELPFVEGINEVKGKQKTDFIRQFSEFGAVQMEV